MWCSFKSEQEIYFSPYTGTTYTVSSGNCPSFSCATSSSLFMLTAGPRCQFTRWRRSRKRLSVCSVLRCPDLWLQCSVSFVHVLEKTHHAWWEINFLLTFETAPFICKHSVFLLEAESTPGPQYPALVLRPLILSLFSLAPPDNSHHFLIFAISFSV